MSANKFIRKWVAEMFLYAQTFVGNICRSVWFFPVWPECWATIQLNFPNARNQHAQCCSAQRTSAQFKQNSRSKFWSWSAFKVVSLFGDNAARSVEVSPWIVLYSFSSSPCIHIHVYIQFPALVQDWITLGFPVFESMPWFCSSFSNFYLHLVSGFQ